MDDTLISLYNPDNIVPINVSKAAEEERPAPINTSLVTYAEKPPTLNCLFKNPDTTPLIKAVVVSISSCFNKISFREITISS